MAKFLNRFFVIGLLSATFALPAFSSERIECYVSESLQGPSKLLTAEMNNNRAVVNSETPHANVTAVFIKYPNLGTKMILAALQDKKSGVRAVNESKRDGTFARVNLEIPTESPKKKVVVYLHCDAIDSQE